MDKDKSSINLQKNLFIYLYKFLTIFKTKIIFTKQNKQFLTFRF